jgi:hypothetical protein
MFGLTLPLTPTLSFPRKGGSDFTSACQSPLPNGEGIGSEAMADSEVSTFVE